MSLKVRINRIEKYLPKRPKIMAFYSIGAEPSMEEYKVAYRKVIEIDPGPKIKLIWFFPYDLKYLFPLMKFTEYDKTLGLYVEGSQVIKFVKRCKYHKNQPFNYMAIESFSISKDGAFIIRHNN